MAVEFVCPPGFHEYVYAGFPPPAETVAVPLFPPLQFTAVEEMVEVSAVGCVMLVVAVVVHPFPSVIVTV